MYAKYEMQIVWYLLNLINFLGKRV
jgi:hypothetical protein